MEQHEELERKLRAFYQSEAPDDPPDDWWNSVLSQPGPQVARREVVILRVPRLAFAIATAAVVVLMVVSGSVSYLLARSGEIPLPNETPSPGIPAWPEQAVQSFAGAALVISSSEGPVSLPDMSLRLRTSGPLVSLGAAVEARMEWTNRSIQVMRVEGRQLVVGKVGEANGSETVLARYLVRADPGDRGEMVVEIPPRVTSRLTPGVYVIWLAVGVRIEGTDSVVDAWIRSNEFVIE